MIFSLVFFVMQAASCGGALPPDLDGDYTKSAHLFSGVSVGDDLNPRRGDKEDWRKFRFVEDTKVNILVVMAPLQVNPVRGKIEVYDDTFAHVQGSPVQPGHNRYSITFSAIGGQDYYVVVMSEKGAAPYQVRLEGVAADPCAACGEGELCTAGRCVKVIEADKLKDVCGGCTEALVCDEEIRTCVYVECVGVRCTSGRECSRRGRCVRVKVDSKPRCGPGETRVRGECVPDVEEPLPDGRPSIRAKIVSVQAGAKGNADITVDKGKLQGVKVGMRGRIPGVPGVTAEVIRVYEVRALVRVDASSNELTDKARVVVFPLGD